MPDLITLVFNVVDPVTVKLEFTVKLLFIVVFCDASTVTAGKLTVCSCSIPEVSADWISPAEVDAFMVVVIYVSYNITQRDVDGTVTTTPAGTVIGPTDSAPLPAVIV